MEQVSDGIFLIREQGNSKRFRPPVNIYVIAGEDGIIYDAGHANCENIDLFKKEYDEIKEYWEKNHGKFNISRVLLSHGHPDHFSGLKAIREYTGAKITVTERMAEIIASKKRYNRTFRGHKPDREYITYKKRKKIRIKVMAFYMNIIYKFFYKMGFCSDPDVIIVERCDISINGEKWKIFPSHGHSDDHITLYNEKTGVLFSGDNILRSVVTWLGPPRSDVKLYIDSLREIAELPNLKLMLPGHGSIIENPRERVVNIIEWRNRRTDQLLELIKSGGENGIGFLYMLTVIYKSPKNYKAWIGAGWIQVTLKCLEQRGDIVFEVRNKDVIYVSTEYRK